MFSFAHCLWKEFTADQCIYLSLSSSTYGGASWLVVLTCRFEDLVAAGVFGQNIGVVILTDGVFRNATGSAIELTNILSSLTLHDTLFSDVGYSNQNSYGGGGVSLTSFTVASTANAAAAVLARCPFTDCKASDGGGLYVEQANTLFSISDCTFQRSFVSDYGGAIFLAGTSPLADQVLFFTCLFANNRAFSGFDLYLDNPNLWSTQSPFDVGTCKSETGDDRVSPKELAGFVDWTWLPAGQWMPSPPPTHSSDSDLANRVGFGLGFGFGLPLLAAAVLVVLVLICYHKRISRYGAEQGHVKEVTGFQPQAHIQYTTAAEPPAPAQGPSGFHSQAPIQYTTAFHPHDTSWSESKGLLGTAPKHVSA
jgi:hypothetical protein